MKQLRKLHGAHRHIRHTPYRYLLVLLLVFLLSYPFFVGSRIGREAMGAFVMAVLVLGVFSATRTKLLRVVAIGLAAPAFVLQLFYLSMRDETTFFAAGIGAMLVVLFTLANMFAYVVRPAAVTADRIAAAVCAYLLLGLLWAGFYAFVDVLVPDSFIALGGGVRQGHFYEFVYFSFTTLTTTGYGDIVPASFHARALANVEQFVGIFYIALLIARLTALYRSSDLKADE